MKFTACIADVFNSFYEEVYAVAFFKVVQQQTIGEVGNSMFFCLQELKKLLKSDSICRSSAEMKKGPVFLTHSVCTY